MLVLAALALLGGEAGASKPRCRMERVEVVPGTSPTQLRVLASLVELEGNLQTLPASAFQLEIGGKAVGKAEAATAVSRAGIETYMVLALETSALYKDTLEKIKEAVGDFLEALPPTVHVQLQLFGNELVAQHLAAVDPADKKTEIKPPVDMIEAPEPPEMPGTPTVRPVGLVRVAMKGLGKKSTMSNELYFLIGKPEKGETLYLGTITYMIPPEPTDSTDSATQ